MGRRIKAFFTCVLCLALVFATLVPVSATERTAPETIQCADFDEAANVLREKMVQRQPVVEVSFENDKADSQVVTDLFNEAVAHTGNPKEGDYLYRHMKNCKVHIVPQSLGNGRYKMTLTFTLDYRTTKEQEAQLDAAVNTLLKQLDLTGKSDYKKVCAIYDYICKNIDYDTIGLMTGDPLVYTAYAALINKSAVCQGYASLFYRLALEVGVDTRFISGVSRNQTHGWNIVRLNGKYYNLDSTWDAPNAKAGMPYRYFLLCDSNFAEHDRDDAFDTNQFRKTYVMANTDYDASAQTLWGDLTGNQVINEEDVIYLLQHVLMPKSFPLN